MFEKILETGRVGRIECRNKSEKAAADESGLRILFL